MPTKLYFHNAATTVTGTLPTTEQATATAAWTTTGATTLRSMNTTIGSAQASLAGTAVAGDGTARDGWYGYFCSDTLLTAQTVGGGTIIFNCADSITNGDPNVRPNSLNIYVWRPSTGTKVGTVRDSTGTSLGGTEPSATNSEQVTHITGITSSAVSAAAGDVIIVEVWTRYTPTGMFQTSTCTLFYDGTTETTTENTVVTSQASYIQFTENLTFGSAAVGRTFVTIV